MNVANDFAAPAHTLQCSGELLVAGCIGRLSQAGEAKRAVLGEAGGYPFFEKGWAITHRIIPERVCPAVVG